LPISRNTEDSLPLEELAGLRPRAWVCVGAGYSREEVKALVLARGRGFTAAAITSGAELAQRLAGVPAESVLGGLARQEALRILLAEPRIGRRLVELRRLRRQGNFFRRLDRAIQAGRLAFAHEAEYEVLAERLAVRFGASALRDELRALTAAYEVWLEARGLWDPVSVLRRATEVLGEVEFAFPAEIVHLTAAAPESLEASFWEALAQRAPVRRVGTAATSEPVATEASWSRWHTLDDAAEALADELAASPDLSREHVLLPDVPAVRRSLLRALAARKIPLADPRDPTRLRWEEGVKWAVLPLELIARDFDRARVISWLRTWYVPEAPSRASSTEALSKPRGVPALISEIHSRGVRQGLGAYAGGWLSSVHSRLGELARRFGGRKTCAELGEAHLRLLRRECKDDARAWLIGFFEAFWKEFVEDTARVGHGDRRAPALWWVERLRERLAEASPPVERVKPEWGVRLLRLQQAPLAVGEGARVRVFGLPPGWLMGEPYGDYYFSAKERDALGAEFAVRSSAQVRAERGAILREWVSAAATLEFLDAGYDADGRERETIAAALAELLVAPPAPVERGAHPRWLASHGAKRAVPPLSLELAPLPRGAAGEPPEITATTLERHSRCGFQSLAFDRWKLRDSREPETDLWPDVRGELLHLAVRALLASRDEQGAFTLSSADAIEVAWREKRPKGLIRSDRIESYARERMVAVLDAFREREREYQERAGTKTLSLDDRSFRLEFPECAIKGTPDRIDEHPDGIFVMDYKSGSGNPSGTEMIDRSYRLQLPFYALAAEEALGKRALGVQFIELSRRASRSAGIFFKPYNGKEPGKLTKTTANSKSLLTSDPNDVWPRLFDSIQETAASYASGRHEALPRVEKRDKECTSCRAADFCGYRRLSEEAVIDE
jgi:hypothetical protein